MEENFVLWACFKLDKFISLLRNGQRFEIFTRNLIINPRNIALDKNLVKDQK